ncbi:MAG: hypothetical protein J0H18_06925 [Rhizobiales bacterium]|nr:hypothetical protein [Hyphomicrobiales bacterium]
MTMFRFMKIGSFCAAMLLAIPVYIPPAAATGAVPIGDLHRYCRKVGNDDTVRNYSHTLYKETAAAFRKLFPGAKRPQNDSDFVMQAQYRCMGGKVMVCFIGANLPCGKMNASRDNPGANEFCRENPDSDFVPLAATGHDTIYSYRCRNGKAEVNEVAWQLDRRGFAKKLWVKLPNR